MAGQYLFNLMGFFFVIAIFVTLLVPILISIINTGAGAVYSSGAITEKDRDLIASVSDKYRKYFGELPFYTFIAFILCAVLYAVKSRVIEEWREA